MSAIIDKPCNIIFGHLRQLLLENAFEAGEYHCAVGGAVIVDDTELNLALALLEYSSLYDDVGEFEIQQGSRQIVPFQEKGRCRYVSSRAKLTGKERCYLTSSTVYLGSLLHQRCPLYACIELRYQVISKTRTTPSRLMSALATGDPQSSCRSLKAICECVRCTRSLQANDSAHQSGI